MRWGPRGKTQTNGGTPDASIGEGDLMNSTSLVRRGAAIVIVVVLAMPSIAATKYPKTAKKPVTKQFGSTTFRDDYAWLENGSDPAVKDWVAKENAVTRSILDTVPARDAIAASLTRLYKAPR